MEWGYVTQRNVTLDDLQHEHDAENVSDRRHDFEERRDDQFHPGVTRDEA